MIVLIPTFDNLYHPLLLNEITYSNLNCPLTKKVWLLSYSPFLATEQRIGLQVLPNSDFVGLINFIFVCPKLS